MSSDPNLPTRSPLQYTPGNLQMMKEYGMDEEEWALEFGGRPHQQRQSPVARSDLVKLGVNVAYWDYCVHKYLPAKLCYEAKGNWWSLPARQCHHELHEYEACQAHEIIRQNQILQRKKRIHSQYTDGEKNWLYADPNWGHMLPRSKYGTRHLKAYMYMGYGVRFADPPTHELTMERNVQYNPEICRTEPHPTWAMHKMAYNLGIGMKMFWNKGAWSSPVYMDIDRSPEMTVPFDPREEGARKMPF